MTQDIQNSDIHQGGPHKMDTKTGMVILFNDGSIYRACFEPEVMLRRIGFSFDYDGGGKIINAELDGRPIPAEEMEEYYLAASTMYYDLHTGELYCRIFTEFEFELLSLVKERLELPRLEIFSRK